MCMTFKLPTAKDGSVVAARSMEFPMGMPTQLSVLPADHAGTGTVGAGNVTDVCAPTVAACTEPV